ncbi:MAG: threonine--tRNA ligase, partial [Pseudomonadota bacterium]
YYEEAMFPPLRVPKEEVDAATRSRQEYRLRPMNCPHHHRVFAAQPRSYRDLPLRLAEYGHVYRWEPSGSLSGLARVRGMCVNDGHIYCTREQVAGELDSVLAMYQRAYAILGITRYHLRLSLRDDSDRDGKYVDDPDAWAWSQRALTDALVRNNLDYQLGRGHAAFYGPKIDVQVPTDVSTHETLSTIQIDFVQPSRLGLSYVARGGDKQTPICIHRAPLSTHERLVAMLLEIHRGAFPTWLAPVQVMVVPVNDDLREYAAQLVARLRSGGFRARLAREAESVAHNVHAATAQRIPNTLVVGQREREQRTVTLRRLGWREQVTLGEGEFEGRLRETVDQRAPTFVLGDGG